MRLSETYSKIIQRSAEKIFGKNVQVFLFGSRTDDRLKGGDIDLLIKTDEIKMTGMNKVIFLADVKKQLGDQSIDIVYDKHGRRSEYFFKTIRQQAIRLC